MPSRHGLLISFEGVEGSGKSTQARLLYDRLKGAGYDCLLSREPGGTPIGEAVRTILLDPASAGMHARTELFLYLASRCQHVYQLILPALAAGRIVIVDRFSDSSLAYQGAGRGLGLRPVARLNKLATAGRRPDLTLVFDVPVGVGRDRKSAGVLDRLESERVEFHQRVRDAYLRIARRAPGRVKVLDGTMRPEELSVRVWGLVEKLLKLKRRSIAGSGTT